MTKSISKLAKFGLMTLASFLPMKSNGQVSANVEAIVPEKTENFHVRSNMFYNLPSDIGGYTWFEFYDEGYFGRTTLTKRVSENVGVGTHAVIGSGLKNRISPRIQLTIPTPEGLSANVSSNPYFVDSDGKVDNVLEVGYFVKKDLPWDMNISSFGLVNLTAKEGSQWTYGEINLQKQFSDFSISYNPSMINRGEGKITPEFEHRLNLKLNLD